MISEDTLAAIAEKMVCSGQGILAADESSATIKKRFDSIGLESTANSRRDWREMLFRSNEAMQDYISGVILFDETIRQKAVDGTPLAKLIENTGAIPGIKVDTGAKTLAGFTGESITEGLDGLRERLAEYYALGARFAKWRAVIDIDSAHIPSDYCIKTNMAALARYAALCQEAGIVPIVEPEVLMDGAHNSDRCYEVTAAGLKCLYQELAEAKVFLEGSILKPNMVICGKKAANRANIEQVAENTVKCLKENVPSAVPGIAFLSGGQSDIEATAHLDAMNRMKDLPWTLTFSYGRALQAAALKAWGGSDYAAGQQAFTHRAKMNGLAATGQWSQDLEA